MDVENLLRPPAESSDEINSEQQVWDADPVHDVQVIAVNQRVNAIDCLAQGKEIG